MSTIRLPTSPAAERALVGAALIDAAALDQALAAGVQLDHFTDGDARRVWGGILAAMAAGQAVSMPTLTEHGVPPALSANLIAEGAGSAAYADNYAAIVLDKARRRAFIEAALQGVQAASSDAPLDSALGMVLQADLGQRSTATKQWPHMRNDILQALFSPTPTGLQTGFGRLDTITGGLPNDLTIVAARPSMGKTNMALQLIRNVASSGKAVLFFSPDTAQLQVQRRMLALELWVSTSALRDPQKVAAYKQRLIQAEALVNSYPIYYRFGPASIFELSLEMRRLHARGNLGLVVIDYLQQISTGKDDADEYKRATLVSRTLKDLATGLGVPVVAMSQLSRGVEGRIDKRPRMADLRNSGQIEQDAAVVVGLYREYYYDPQNGDPNRAEWIFMKQKDGPTGTLPMFYELGVGFAETSESFQEY